MNKVKIPLLIMGVSAIFSTASAQPQQLIIPKIPIEKIANGVDYELFAKEFEITGTIKYCQGKDGIKVPGIMTHLIEPVAFVEAVSRPWYFRTINLSISKSTLKTLRKMGTSRTSGIHAYYHYIKFPLFSMIIPDNKGLLCFQHGGMDFGYMTETDPTSSIPGVKLRMFADMVQLFSPQGLASTIFDCIATTTAQFQERPSKYVSKIRNTFYYNCGCDGITGISQKEGHTQDPYTSSVAAVCSTLNLMQYSGMLKKSTSFSIGGPDTSCSEKIYPRILKTQWKLQPFYPYTLDSIELGLTGLQWDNFASSGAINDDAVFLLWKRRDYAMGSYNCN